MDDMDEREDEEDGDVSGAVATCAGDMTDLFAAVCSLLAVVFSHSLLLFTGLLLLLVLLVFADTDRLYWFGRDELNCKSDCCCCSSSICFGCGW